jgi:hypothetical protein
MESNDQNLLWLLHSPVNEPTKTTQHILPAEILSGQRNTLP